MKFLVAATLPLATLAFQGPAISGRTATSLAANPSKTLFQGDPKKDRLLIEQPGTQWDRTVISGKEVPAPAKKIAGKNDFADPKTAVLIPQPATQWEGTVTSGKEVAKANKKVGGSNDFSDPKTAILIPQPATQWEGTVTSGKEGAKANKKVNGKNDFADPKTAVLIKQPGVQWMEPMPEPTEKGAWTNAASSQGGVSSA